MTTPTSLEGDFDSSIKDLYSILQQISSHMTTREPPLWVDCACKYMLVYFKAEQKEAFYKSFYNTFMMHKSNFQRSIITDGEIDDEWLLDLSPNTLVESKKKKKKGFSLSEPRGVCVFFDMNEPQLINYRICIAEAYSEACNYFQKCVKNGSSTDLPPRLLLSFYRCVYFSAKKLETPQDEISVLTQNIGILDTIVAQPQNVNKPQNVGNGMNFLNNIIDNFRKNTNFDPSNLTKSLGGFLGEDATSKIGKAMNILKKNLDSEKPTNIGDIVGGFQKTLQDPELGEVMGDVLTKANNFVSSLTSNTNIGTEQHISPEDQE